MRVRRLSVLSSSFRRANAGDFRKLAPALALTVFAVSGCASINGAQDPIGKDDFLNQADAVCPSPDQRNDFNAMAPGTPRRVLRDGAIADCVKAIDIKYAQFKSDLQQDSVFGNLVPDVLTLGLTGGAAITKGETAKEFAQGALAAGGIGKAIDKDVFYQQTMPAVEATMDADRATILAGILNSEKNDSTATNYTLDNAELDLEAYQNAGNLYTAIATLTKSATDGAQAASAQVQDAQDAAYVPSPLNPDQLSALKKITHYIKPAAGDPPGLKNPDDRAKLDKIADALQIPHTAAEAWNTERGQIIQKIVQMVQGNPDPSVGLAAVQKALTGLIPS